MLGRWRSPFSHYAGHPRDLIKIRKIQYNKRPCETTQQNHKARLANIEKSNFSFGKIWNRTQENSEY